KAIQITHSTAVNFPGSMTVNSITVASPQDTMNTLFLNNVGVSSPVTANEVTIGTNSTLLMLSSSLLANYVNVNGTFNQGFFSGVTVTNNLGLGNGVPGNYNLSNGTLTVFGIEAVGVSGDSTFTQEGGYHLAGVVLVPQAGHFKLRGGQLGGHVELLGGLFEQTGGDLSVESLSLSYYNSRLVQNGGTSTIGTGTVGEHSTFADPPSFYLLSNSVAVCRGDFSVNSLGIFEQDGGSNTINGTLWIDSDTSRPFAPIRGSFTLNRGQLRTQNITVSGVYNQGGGTNLSAGQLMITGAPYSACTLSGGWLSTSNTIMQGGNFTQAGGRHQVSDTLRVSGGGEPAYGMTGGQVIAPTIEITYGTFAHRGGSVSNATLLRLSGWWEEFAGNQQFGQLQIGGPDGSLWMGTNAAILRFANSSGQTWAGGILHIRNWSGSLNGGGGNQVIFGNSSSGLTPAQVAQIRFDFYPSTQYSAKILPTGEVVPDPSGAPYAPTDLTALGFSGNQINLAWTDNSLAETGFKIERSLDGANFVQIATVAANTTSYANTGLAPMTAYYFRVRAYNANGDSSYSAVAEASTKSSGAAPLPGMVAWWPGENSADDVIGNHNGTTPYGIAYAPGKSGQAFDFNGSNSRVFVPDSPDFVPTNGFTIEGWFNARQATDAVIAMRGDDRGGMDSWIIKMLNSGDLAFQIYDDQNNYTLIYTPVQTGQWRHFAATFDSASGNMKLYTNGVVAVQNSTPMRPIGAYPPSWNPGIGIGNQSGTINHASFDGLIDDLALYSRALSAAEIQSIYNSGSAGKAGLSQPPMLSLQTQSGGSMRLTIAGVPGRSYEVQVSTNLLNWLAWTQVNSTGTNSVVDSNTAGQPRRFYRARLMP
ncbi:MAG TPA: LamG-like jellyroll fold domain-containing protein, partial [Candidatus Saccharimonadales bacterium]|nr:LamG-like jellyroll fold domain-containing protein [Candidatus Saccharimonadales bacterium]